MLAASEIPLGISHVKETFGHAVAECRQTKAVWHGFFASMPGRNRNARKGPGGLSGLHSRLGGQAGAPSARNGPMGTPPAWTGDADARPARRRSASSAATVCDRLPARPPGRPFLLAILWLSCPPPPEANLSGPLPSLLPAPPVPARRPAEGARRRPRLGGGEGVHVDAVQLPLPFATEGQSWQAGAPGRR